MSDNKYMIYRALHPGGDLAPEYKELDLGFAADDIYLKHGDNYVSIAAILDNYISYADNAELTFIGTDRPINPRARIWVDKTNYGGGKEIQTITVGQ